MRVAFPLIISTAAVTVQMLVDRVFLTWYDTDAMAASALAGIIAYTTISFFIGVCLYVNTFVAQYDGSRQKKQIGCAVWQGLYFAFFSGIIVMMLSCLSEHIINAVGHSEALRHYEISYFRILCYAGLPLLLNHTFSCFYTGRTKTKTVMCVNVISTLINVFLDYCMIFGNFGFPSMGVSGAAWATFSCLSFQTLIYIILFLQAENRKNYNTLAGWRFDYKIFKRLMKFGSPAGVQQLLEILGFAFFMIFLGKIDDNALAASSIAINISNIGWMPICGISCAVSSLVGRALGQDKPRIAVRSTWSAIYIGIVYLSIMAACYITMPDILMYPFAHRADPQQLAAIAPTVKNLLLFLAVFCMFDAYHAIFSAALRGAGDTRFVMLTGVLGNWILMILPSWLLMVFMDGFNRIYWLWTSMLVCFLSLAVLLFFRFMGGKWKKMRVIDMPYIEVPSNVPSAFAIDEIT